MFRRKRKGCSFIHKVVDDHVSVFFDRSYKVLDIGASYIKEADDFEAAFQYKLPAQLPEDVFVLYFPSKWLHATKQILEEIKARMRPDSVIVIVESSDDSSGQEMCALGDQLRAMWGNQCVIDKTAYLGEINWLKGHHIIAGLLWLSSSGQSISLEQLTVY